MNEFSKVFSNFVKKNSINDGKPHRDKPHRMSDVVVMLILIMFHHGEFRHLKSLYINHICKHCTHLFPKTVSYNHFVEFIRDSTTNTMLIFR